jgi:hypothetical protein
VDKENTTALALASLLGLGLLGAYLAIRMKGGSPAGQPAPEAGAAPEAEAAPTAVAAETAPV